MFRLLLILTYRLDDKGQGFWLSPSTDVRSIPFNCFIHSNEHLPLYTWKTNLANKYRLLKVIPRGCSLRPPRLLYWGKGRAMAGKPALLFLTSEVCSLQASFPLQCSHRRGLPLPPSPSVLPRCCSPALPPFHSGRSLQQLSPFTPATRHSPIREPLPSVGYLFCAHRCAGPFSVMLVTEQKAPVDTYAFSYMYPPKDSILWENSWNIVTCPDREKRLHLISQRSGRAHTCM